jgi:hypothetical protein
MNQLPALLIGTFFIVYVCYLLVRFIIGLPERVAGLRRRRLRNPTIILSFRSLDTVSRDDMQEWLEKEGFVNGTIWESELKDG